MEVSIIWAFVKSFFSFFLKPPGLYIAIVLGIIGAIWLSGERGWHRGVAFQKNEYAVALQKAQIAALKEGMKRQAALDKGMADAAFKAGEKAGQEKAKTVTLIKEVPVYVTQKVDAEFAVPCAVYRLHNASALGLEASLINLPAGLTDESACPIKTSGLISTIIENYGIAREQAAQITGLQDLARTLVKQINGEN